MNADTRPIVLITGAAGNLGQSVAQALSAQYRIVGLDRSAPDIGFPVFEVDLGSDDSVESALGKVRAAFGSTLASVVHLAAYFDFTGEAHPLYQSVNVDGTRRLLRALQRFEVAQFLYASTMLVHAPCRPGETINEQHAVEPRWVYPKSKAAAEAVVRAEHQHIPYVILRLAGVYDSHTMVPTLAHQIARVYERQLQSHFYSGNTLVGQSALHREDMLDAIRRAIDRRATLPAQTTLLIGEAQAIGYGALQQALGRLMHGSHTWLTLRVPKPLAAAGAWLHGLMEPVIPDRIDGGEPAFIRPFMVAMADDHYALDIRRAQELLGWQPRHHLADELPQLVRALQADPLAWYAANGIQPPTWITQADAATEQPPAQGAAPAGAASAVAHPNPETLRTRHEAQRRSEHRESRWAHFANMALGSWLVTQPPLIDVQEPLLRAGEFALGLLLIAAAGCCLSWRAVWARWFCAGIGMAVMALPFIGATSNAAAYLSDTLVGALIFGFAVCTKPEPGPSAVAALSGPTTPPGWSYNPSDWSQRVPIVVLALVGLYVSRYLAAYQLGHISGVWEPFFAGAPEDPRNGTEEIITSWVSKAFPVSDAALGGYTYLLEILTGLVGSRQRWRTMPWLVLLFGLMIVPLGVTTILFIVIQPVVLGTWSTLALVGGAAVLLQIPYSLDELLATLQFLHRRHQAGQPWLRVLLRGDTDAMPAGAAQPANLVDEFEQSPRLILRSMVVGGVSLPWNLALAAAIGVLLLFTRVTLGGHLGEDGNLANAHHIIGSLVLTVVGVAAAEVARPVRVLNALLGVALLLTPFWFVADNTATAVSVALGLALVGLSVRRGPIRQQYGPWNRRLA